MLANPQHEEQLQACVDCSGVTAFASRHPLGLEMQVGERGKSLSGGQKQAVGIARAMLAGPDIMFLDEPTAQMDTMTEGAFVKGFAGWLGPETTLLIATHRNSLLDLVDRVIVIEDGRVALDGPKAQVLKTLQAPRKPTPNRRGTKNARK
ncbi:MAG: ATP-binding cassette domain-containing protein [Pseudomonadota bacterium]